MFSCVTRLLFAPPSRSSLRVAKISVRGGRRGFQRRSLARRNLAFLVLLLQDDFNPIEWIRNPCQHSAGWNRVGSFLDAPSWSRLCVCPYALNRSCHSCASVARARPGSANRPTSFPFSRVLAFRGRCRSRRISRVNVPVSGARRGPRPPSTGLCALAVARRARRCFSPGFLTDLPPGCPAHDRRESVPASRCPRRAVHFCPSPVHVCFMYFRSLLCGAYVFIILVSS